MINLEAKTQNEKLILQHLEKNASDVLIEKINSGKKTLKECWEFIKGEARKKAVNGCACVDDETVYGWAMHFFEEDGIKPKKTRQPVCDVDSPKDTAVVKEEKKPKAKKKPMSDESQMTFDFL